jgi:HNH endonuclease
MQPYTYPNSPHVRLHGPAGYAAYKSYRDWLRDEFLFRCAYCLHREKWSPPRGAWHIDHLLSQEEFPDQINEYDNLVYACAGCNLAKGKRDVPDPCSCLLHDAVEVFEDGRIEARTPEARRTIRVLGLDSPEDTEFRCQLIGIYQLKDDDYEKFLNWMGYPAKLPDLAAKSKRCPANTRPEGIEKSCCALRERNELPDYY